MIDETLRDVQDIFRNVFCDQEITINDKTDSSSIEEWDSLAHIILISAIEKFYKIRFALGEIQELKNVGDMILLIKSKTNE